MKDESIRYLLHNEIDLAAWDKCIDNASNGLVYGYSFYLDFMSPGWDGLVLGNYEYVMPLTWKSKYGVSYLYQPQFSASLGVFGTGITDTVVAAFIQAIPSKFRVIEIDLNRENNLIAMDTGMFVRTNYILPLNWSYVEISQKYRDNIKRNCKKARQFNCSYREEIDVDDVIKLSKSQMQAISNLTDSDYDEFKKLFDYLLAREQALACGVYTSENVLIASCVYFFSHDRAYYILVGNHPNSKVMGASHFLIDQFIEKRAGSNLTLDFEGSDVRNLAFFYGSFGASTETYPALRLNRIPWYLRWLKRKAIR
ncbi:MAG: hypothetical protein H7Y31_04535 [Chitinophagaceae bacterium]|nr:hypothetical protein [Chitinophagaceae bacterium]